MRKALFALAVCSTFLLSGCISYVAPVMPPQGLFFTSISAPLDTDAEATDVSNMSSGSASTLCVLKLFAFGDASVATAAREGNLATVEHLDYSYLNVLFFFENFTVTAYGKDLYDE